MSKKRSRKEKTAAHTEKKQGRQYTTEQVMKIMIELMFATFAQPASCGIDVRVRA